MSRLVLGVLVVVACLFGGVLGSRQRPMELRPLDTEETVVPASHSEADAPSIRVLLQMHESAGHEHRFQAEVNALVAALKRQAGTDAAETDEAERALDQAAIEHAIDAQDKADALAFEAHQSELASSADAADAIAADEQAEASDEYESGVFGEAAPEPAAESVEATSDSEIDTTPFNAGSAALIEEMDVVADTETAEAEEHAAAAHQFELESSSLVADQLAADELLSSDNHEFESEVSDEAPADAAAESVEAEQESEIDTEPFNAGPAFIQENESETESETESESDETEFETEVFGEAPVSEDQSEIVEAEGTANEDAWDAGSASFVQESESDETSADDESSDETEFETEVFGEAPVSEEQSEIVEAEGTAHEDAWDAGSASFVESSAAETKDEEEEEETEESDTLLVGVDSGDEMAVNEAIAKQIDMDSSSDESSMRQSLEQDGQYQQAVEQAANEAAVEAELDAASESESEEEDTALVQVGGDWKDPPVWWKAPEEEMANADQQPWPLDPNFPMSVLDPPPNLPLANIEDTNNYPPMADPNMAFNVDPTAFPQTTPKVGTEDPSFASFSINGR